MSTITDITTVSQWNEHLGSVPEHALLIILFHAPWAAPCAQMRTVLDTLASEYPVANPLATSWVSINAEELSDISEHYNVTAVPFLILMQNKKVVDSVSGSNAPKVRAAIEKHAKRWDAVPAPAAANAGVAVTAEPVDPSKEAAGAGATEAERKKDLLSRLAELVKASPVMLFMKGTPSAPECGFSRQIVGILRERSVKYGFFNILADDEVRQGLKEFADWPTYPQLWVGGELVGGLDIVRDELASDPAFLNAYSVNATMVT